MTREQFKEMLIRMHPNSRYSVEHGPVLMLPALAVAQRVFIDGYHMYSHADVSNLRKQLLHCEQHGHFNFEDEQCSTSTSSSPGVSPKAP